MKPRCLVVRWGAYGDMVIMSPLLRLLHDDGYHVELSCVQRSLPVLQRNPFVDKFTLYKEDSVPIAELDDYFSKISSGYDRFINLTGSLEDYLLLPPWNPKHRLSKEERHAHCNRNYYDHTLAVAGYPEVTGKNGEMYFSRLEDDLMRKFFAKLSGRFVILWALAGSSPHKVWPYTEYAARIFLSRHPEAEIIFVGDPLCGIIEFSHPRVREYSGKWPVWKSLLATKYADLVIGPETGVANAAGCYDTPKIVFLSHSTEENLTKYWTNCQAISAPVECYPCHQLHYTIEHCQLDPKLRTPLCAARIGLEEVLAAMERVYSDWRESGRFCEPRRSNGLRR